MEMTQALLFLAFVASVTAFAPSQTTFGIRSVASFRTQSASKLSMVADGERKKVVVVGNVSWFSLLS